MQIWIDGDACPKAIKEIIFRVAKRTKAPIVIVANHSITIPPSPYITKVQVGSGFDVVDKYIVEHLQAKDLVITADIPFADEVVSKGAFALNPRGELYTENNIKQLLGNRNMNESLRSSGQMVGGPSKLGAKEVQRFANALDSWVAKNLN
ncbi:MAG: YaiI/YqxD family protein [Legionellaceae bacterium]|nr:YaiI/YqxD family protein [Legionellaceae bacterium]